MPNVSQTVHSHTKGGTPPLRRTMIPAQDYVGRGSVCPPCAAPSLKADPQSHLIGDGARSTPRLMRPPSHYHMLCIKGDTRSISWGAPRLNHPTQTTLTAHSDGTFYAPAQYQASQHEPHTFPPHSSAPTLAWIVHTAIAGWEVSVPALYRVSANGRECVQIGECSVVLLFR